MRSLPVRLPYLVGAAAMVGALALSAVVNRRLAAKAERDNPPQGRFIEVDGVRLHYVERGTGPALVLLHGNGSMIQDFESSGLLARAAGSFRVLAFDRPGYGHSERPRTTIWTAEAQAELIGKALEQLGIRSAIVLGHSWGTLVALGLARRRPGLVDALVLAGGYFFPSVRADVILMSGPAVPVAGDLYRYTLAPWISRLLWPRLLRKMFGPAPVPAKFDRFPREMTFRPSQLRASAAESALMIPAAYAAAEHYADLRLPVVIIAGESDRLVDIKDQSARLHHTIEGSSFHELPGHGHMIHQTATEALWSAIEEAAHYARERNRVSEPRLPSAA